MDKKLRNIMDELECTTDIAITLFKESKDIAYLNRALATLKIVQAPNTEFNDKLNELIKRIESTER